MSTLVFFYLLVQAGSSRLSFPFELVFLANPSHQNVDTTINPNQIILVFQDKVVRRMPSPSPSNASTNSTTSLVSEGKKSINSGAAKFGKYLFHFSPPPLLLLLSLPHCLSIWFQWKKREKLRPSFGKLQECRKQIKRVYVFSRNQSAPTKKLNRLLGEL